MIDYIYSVDFPHSYTKLRLQSVEHIFDWGICRAVFWSVYYLLTSRQNGLLYKGIYVGLEVIHKKSPRTIILLQGYVSNDKFDKVDILCSCRPRLLLNTTPPLTCCRNCEGDSPLNSSSILPFLYYSGMKVGLSIMSVASFQHDSTLTNIYQRHCRNPDHTEWILHCPKHVSPHDILRGKGLNGRRRA